MYIDSKSQVQNPTKNNNIAISFSKKKKLNAQLRCYFVSGQKIFFLILIYPAESNVFFTFEMVLMCFFTYLI